MFKKRGQPENFFTNHKLWMGVTTLIGTIVGAGILGIPYVISQSGFLVGSIIIILLGVSLLFLNLLTGEIVLRTKKQHQLTGYAERYLGRWGKRLMAFSLMFSIYGALTAYLIGEGETLKAIFGFLNFGTPLFYSLVFFSIAFLIVYKGIKAAGKMELILIISLLLIIILIGVFSFEQVKVENLTTINLAKFFIPYGVIFFALMGSPAIPEVQEVLENKKQKIRKVIILGSIIPIVLYILFALFVLGIVGLDNFNSLQPNERIATIALSIFSSPILGMFANIVAVLAMFTSFLTLGIALVEMYEFDYHLSRRKALLLAFSLPLIITLFKLSTFIAVIATTGAIAGGFEGILILLMYQKVKKLGDRTPEYSINTSKYFSYFLILLFGLGIVYQIFINLF
ncbi:MAG: amino acid permease [Nanoarchaeota archaeon]|nr:amino acid permease [Nanoarchaeota archaeon]MBU1643782.1 amino acid permease [Nanoarchaeota archaeon]MBU1977006.1 amino acid permease [Nanoarchaeota archaeon]